MTDIELSRSGTPAHVMKAARLARITRNAEAQEWLGWEMSGVPNTSAGRLWMTATNRWTDREQQKGYWAAASSIQSEADAHRGALAGHSAPANLAGDYVNVAMTNRARNINTISTGISSMERILAAVDTKIYEFAANTHAELTYSELQRSFFEQLQADIDGKLTTVGGPSLKLVESVSERLSSEDSAAVGQAMTTCRQLVDRTADMLFPAEDEPYILKGGLALNVKADKVKNRLNAYIDRCGVTGGRAERLGTTLNHLYSRISAGVHDNDSVSSVEARFIFLNTYSLIGEIINLPGPGADHA